MLLPYSKLTMASHCKIKLPWSSRPYVIWSLPFSPTLSPPTYCLFYSVRAMLVFWSSSMPSCSNFRTFTFIFHSICNIISQILSWLIPLFYSDLFSMSPLQRGLLSLPCTNHSLFPNHCLLPIYFIISPRPPTI